MNLEKLIQVIDHAFENLDMYLDQRPTDDTTARLVTHLLAVGIETLRGDIADLVTSDRIVQKAADGTKAALQ